MSRSWLDCMHPKQGDRLARPGPRYAVFPSVALFLAFHMPSALSFNHCIQLLSLYCGRGIEADWLMIVFTGPNSSGTTCSRTGGDAVVALSGWESGQLPSTYLK